MENLQTLTENYLEYCRTQKCLDEKTLKAYRIDLRQFSEEPSLEKITEITTNALEDYIVIPLHTVEKFLTMIYTQRDNAKTNYQRRNALRDAAVSELLFATGMRISDLCSLKNEDINLHDGSILIYGKGDKERRIHIGNDSVSQLRFISSVTAHITAHFCT